MSIQHLTNIISPILKTIRYWNKSDPFATFQSLRKNENIPKPSKGHVLILPIRVSPTSNLFEGLLGYALRLRGYRVTTLHCSQCLTHCENISKNRSSVLTCSLCLYEQNRFASVFDLEELKFSDCLSSQRRLELQKIAETLPLSEIFKCIHRNIPIGQHVESGVSRYLLSSTIDLNQNEKIIRQFLLTGLISAEATKEALHRIKPDFVVASHGIYSTWGSALEACTSENYHSIVWGRGYIGSGSIMAAHNASYLFDTIHESCELWENMTLSEKQKVQLDEYFIAKQNPASKVDYVNYYSNTDKTVQDVYSELNLDPKRPKIGLYPNIPWDGKTFSATPKFPDLDTFVIAIMQWLEKNPQVDLIIRAHPAETHSKHNKGVEKFIDVLVRLYPKLPSNLIYIKPESSISSYQISKICNVAVLYASTLAMEFAYFGHPVIQVGYSNVSNKGILFDAPDSAELYKKLDQAASGIITVSNTMLERAKKYAYYWVYKRHIPELNMNLDKLMFKSFNLETSMDLAEGQNPTMDHFIRCCETHNPFIIDDRKT